MNITDIRIRIVKKDEHKLKAVASVTIDDSFVVHDIKIIDGNDGYYIAMPSRKTPDGEFKDIAHPLNTPTRDKLKQQVLAAFEKARLEQPAE
ncbi:MAG: septation regulator SpoVG [Firmicutes bacterium]|nr:septation regulator SpoVG [Bacillota bacterium]